MFAGSQCFKRLLPSALADAGIAAGKICFGNLQVEHWLPFGLIPSLDDLVRFLFLAGLQTGAFAGPGIHAIECASPVATTD